MNDIKKQIQSINKQLAAHRQSIQKLKDDKNAKRERMAELRAMPVSKADFLKLLKENIKLQGDLYASKQKASIKIENDYKTPLNKASFTSLLSPFNNAHNERMPEHTTWLFNAISGGFLQELGDNTTALQTLCWLMPEVVYERIVAVVDDAFGGQWGNDDLPSVDERKAEIERLKAEIEQIEQILSEVEVVAVDDNPVKTQALNVMAVMYK